MARGLSFYKEVERSEIRELTCPKYGYAIYFGQHWA
jgi:hypothetical protein